MLPSALDRVTDITNQAKGRRIAVFLDYDGTLTPIVETPGESIMTEDMRDAVTKLSRNCTVGIISGRDLKDIQNKMKIDSLIYAGSHGFDIADYTGLKIKSQAGTEFLPVLDKAERALSEKLCSIEGVLVERKKFAIAVHYRLVTPEETELVSEIVDKVVSVYPELRKTYGKKIFELQPDIDWHKGKALLTLLNALRLNGEDVLPFYIGDDVTDEDAFRVLKDRGFGIVVWDEPYETAASYCLKNPEEVLKFLLKLISSTGCHE